MVKFLETNAPDVDVRFHGVALPMRMSVDALLRQRPTSDPITLNMIMRDVMSCVMSHMPTSYTNLTVVMADIARATSTWPVGVIFDSHAAAYKFVSMRSHYFTMCLAESFSHGGAGHGCMLSDINMVGKEFGDNIMQMRASITQAMTEIDWSNACAY